ncbi:UNVERIFIED_CONTAM: hypothetical protein Sradi_0063500 [Sesamum radiatum]|uniref:Uncharacterized protein n=1 Tax=Sesamum radiatum TaxID=300843 RepID=A0AAW2WJ39_SESRA
MPVVLERLPRNSSIMLETFGNTKWLHDLADWGKSSLAVVVRYWKQTLAYLLGHIKACCSDKSASAICDVEKLISYAQLHSGNAFPEMNSASNVQQSLKKPPKTSDETMKELVCDTDDNAWKFSFFKPPRRHQTLITKPSTSVPKRQVIQLTSPVENRPGSMRLGAGVQKRFQPPRLDDWYRPILQLDFLWLLD